MIRFILVALAISSGSHLSAEVLYSELPPNESAKGILQIRNAKRGESIVHKTVLIDRDKDGVFNERMDEFFLGDSLVLSISDLTRGRSVDCKNLKSGELSLIYGDNNWKPQKILIRNDASSEYFLLMENGFYQAAPDKVRESVIRQLGPIEHSSK